MRSREPDGLTPVQESLYLTLHLRALDARSADPILGDTASAELADALDHDFSPQRTQRSVVLDLATPHEPERWDAGPTLVEELLLARSPEIARYPRCCARSPGSAPAAPASRERGTVSSATGSDAARAVPS